VGFVLNPPILRRISYPTEFLAETMSSEGAAPRILDNEGVCLEEKFYLDPSSFCKYSLCVSPKVSYSARAVIVSPAIFPPCKVVNNPFPSH